MAPFPRQEDEVATNTSPSSANPENGSSNNDNDDPNSRTRLEDLGYGVSSFYTILQPGKILHSIVCAFPHGGSCQIASSYNGLLFLQFLSPWFFPLSL